MTQGRQTWDAVVVGGGIAGLVAARELSTSGLRTLVLEAWRWPGGVVGRHTVDGLELDAGAESFATRGGIVADLAGELGLTAQVVSPEPYPAWVALPSGMGPLPHTGLLGIPAHPLAADVRHTLGWWGSRRAAMDRLLPTRRGIAPEGEVTTLGALVRARMGKRVLDRLVRPVVAGVHAAEPDEIAVDAVAPGLVAAVLREGALSLAVRALRSDAPAGSAVASLAGGLHVLVDALAADVRAQGGEVRCSAPASAISRAPDGSFRITVGGEDGGTIATNRLVIATPKATELLTSVAPDLAELHTDSGADVVLATLVLDAPQLDGHPRGTGVLVAKGTPGIRAKALTHATAKWGWLARLAGPSRHVVRLSYGRADDAQHADQLTPLPTDTEGLTALALRDTSAIFGVPVQAEHLHASSRVTWKQSLPVPSAAHRETVRRVREVIAEIPGLAVTGAWVAGNGLASVVPDARAAAAELMDPVDRS